MSVAIGVLCDESLIFASDSRTTDARTGRILTDKAQKVFRIDFANKKSGLLAQAGSADLGNRVVEVLQTLAKETKLDAPRAFADTVERAMAQVKADIRKQIGESADAVRQYFIDYELELMGAHWLDDSPYWFSSNVHSGFSSPIRGHYCAIGGGATLADFILRGFSFEFMHHEASLAAMLYAITEIKACDNRIGGELQAGYVLSATKWCTDLVDSKSIKDRVEAVMECKSEVDGEWLQKLDDIFKRVAQRWS